MNKYRNHKRFNSRLKHLNTWYESFVNKLSIYCIEDKSGMKLNKPSYVSVFKKQTI